MLVFLIMFSALLAAAVFVQMPLSSQRWIHVAHEQNNNLYLITVEPTLTATLLLWPPLWPGEIALNLLYKNPFNTATS